MSLKYRDKNGTERVISGLTPGGDLEYGAVATRKGQTGALNLATGRNTYDIVFSENMPDGNYITELGVLSWPTGADTGGKITVLEGENSKRATGFTIYIYNATGATQTVNISWQAYKLYTVADAEALYSKVLDMEAMIPSSASSTNKFATADDLRTETRTLDRRLDDVEDVVPTSASITNKLATAADVEEAMENAGLQVCELVPSSPQDKDVMLYIGEETGFTKGGIYQYVADPGAWVLISTADVDLSKYETSWTGTKAEWDALPANEKKQYKIANITDDVIGGEVADVIQDGLMSPVTSNAVYDGLANKQDTLTFDTTPTSGSTNPVTSGGIYTKIYNESLKNGYRNSSGFNEFWGNAGTYLATTNANHDTFFVIKIFGNTIAGCGFVKLNNNASVITPNKIVLGGNLDWVTKVDYLHMQFSVSGGSEHVSVWSVKNAKVTIAAGSL